MPSVVGESVVRIGVDDSRMRKGLAATQSRAVKGISQMGAQMKGALAGIGASLGIVGVIGGFKSMAGAAINFESAMTKSLAIMGDVSDEQRNKMEKLAKQMSVQFGESADKVAESFFFLASAGLDLEQQMAALPAVMQFSKAGAFDLALATDLLTDAQSALGLTSKDAAKNQMSMVRVSDVLVKANTLANASVAQFSQALVTKAGAALKVLNKDVEEGVAVLAAFADQGTKGQLAGNALGIVLRDLQTAALNNKDAFANASVAVFDATGKMRNMADIVGDLETRLGSMGDEQRKAELAALGFADRSQAFLLTLLGTSESIRTYESELRKAGGTTKDVSDNQMKSMEERLKRLKAQFGLIAIQIGGPIVEGFISILQPIANIVTAIAKWNTENNNIVGTIAKVMLVIAGLVAAFFAAKFAIGLFIAAIGGIVSAIGIMFAIAGKILAVIFSPFILLVPVILAGVAAVTVFTTALVLIGIRIVAFIKNVWKLGTIQDALAANVKKWQQAWENVVAVVKALFNGFISFMDAMVTRLASALGISLEGWEGDLADTLTTMVEDVSNWVLRVTQWFRVLSENVDLVFDIIRASLQFTLAVFLDNWRNVLAQAVTIIVAVFDGIVAIVKQRFIDLGNLVKQLGVVWLAAMKLNGVLLTEAFFGIINNWRAIFSAVWDAIISHLRTRISQMLTIIQALADAMAAVGEAIATGLEDGMEAGAEAAKAAFNFLKDKIFGEEAEEEAAEVAASAAKKEAEVLNKTLADKGVIEDQLTPQERIAAAGKAYLDEVKKLGEFLDPTQALMAGKRAFDKSIAASGVQFGIDITGTEAQAALKEINAARQKLDDKFRELAQRQREERKEQAALPPSPDRVLPKTIEAVKNVVNKLAEVAKKPQTFKFEAAFVGIQEFNSMVQQKMLDEFNKTNDTDAQILDVNKRQENILERIDASTKKTADNPAGLRQGGVAA